MLYNEFISVKPSWNVHREKKKMFSWEKRCDSEACGLCICFNYLPTYEVGALIEWKENAEKTYFVNI